MKSIASTNYDVFCSHEFPRLYAKVANRFVNINVECPYGFPFTATFHQGAMIPLGESNIGLFLSAGYRRNGNWLYSMQCLNCMACLSLRLKVLDFCANRNQLRTKKRNADLDVEIMPLLWDAENSALCDKFLKARYPKEESSALMYFQDFFVNSIATTMQLQYRLEGRLVGGSIVDVGQRWMNAVYFYFDPDESKRSLGIWNILFLIELCQRWRIDYLYLGYLISELSSMNYKKNFKPYQILIGENWQTIS